jgi:hypothetical protein
MKTILLLTGVFACFCSYTQNLQFENPPASPGIFADGVINTVNYERDFALSPDGKELFYTLQAPKQGVFQTILYLHKDANGKWSGPEVAPFAGNYSDLEPAFSGDGQKLFFSSNRPLHGNKPKDFDIWWVEKKNGTWGEPKNIGPPVNTSGDEYYPSITNSGNLYFTATQKNAVGKEDIFLAKLEENKYQEPVALDTAINSPAYEFNAFVSPDERIIIFSSYGRKDDQGGGDLYMSIKNELGQWQKATNLGWINSAQLDYCPFISFDKKIFFFTSDRHELKTCYPYGTNYKELLQSFASLMNGGGNIYWMDFERLIVK